MFIKYTHTRAYMFKKIDTYVYVSYILKNKLNERGFIMVEEYRDIIGFEGIYKVSNYGNVKSLGNSKSRKEKLLKSQRKTNGYLSVTLYKNGKSKSYFVHRLVAQAFIPNPESKPEVNHINGIKTDNNVKNLEWNTRTENEQHAYTTGLCDAGKKAKSRPVLCVTTGKIYESMTEAARQTGTSHSNIHKCCNGKRKIAGGFEWQYVEE